MITVVVHVDAPVGQAIGVKEQLAMYLDADMRPKMVAALRAQLAAWEEELEEKKQC